jgi:hypothetical protein
MVVINNNEEAKTTETARYNEFLKHYTSGTDVMDGTTLNDLSTLTIPGKSVLILELK